MQPKINLSEREVDFQNESNLNFIRVPILYGKLVFACILQKSVKIIKHVWITCTRNIR